MKVLFLVNNPYNSLNPYTSTIIEGLRKLNKKIHIDWGIDKLWNETAFTFDIIHIMWPHLLLVNGRYTSEDLKNRLEQLKTSNIKIVSTCHNLKPHYSNNAETIKAYDIAYKESNIILHLGKYSLDFFKQEYPNVENLLIFHHIYEDRYKIRYDKFTAQKN